MNKKINTLTRAASKVYDAIVRRRVNRYGPRERSLSKLHSCASTIQDASHRLQLATERRWLAAAGNILFRLRFDLKELECEVASAVRELDRAHVDSPTYRDVYGEVQALQQEFGEVNCDAKDRSLIVVTEPIALEDIDLGRFELRLELDRVAEGEQADCLRVVALDPNPAATDDSVTHPHVNDERLCAGDATGPMRAALVAGRLCDFFMLARSVLNTYNASSAYVRLEQWDGRPCQDCGYTMNDDDSYWCEGCENEFCDECFSCCCSCDASRCRGCLTSCTACEEYSCIGCLEPCTECGEVCCPACLKEKVCSSCKDDKEKSNEEYTNDKHEKHRESTSDPNALRIGPASQPNPGPAPAPGAR